MIIKYRNENTNRNKPANEVIEQEAILISPTADKKNSPGFYIYDVFGNYNVHIDFTQLLEVHA